ncbi:TetR/AcrR family transcriptional regulator [Subtercola lobariae]|uniref:TetR family transcriptional regulator n=1 Tax=Subtercola lobariae TaxID=1588641 RepID=A0A917BDY1_9MICO|nr:TetR/AcrR family transcriptional regulator [Subtercola lobariae]GGF39384.1 TetR family transcriptional regulator [Subtercola lobariae]
MTATPTDERAQQARPKRADARRNEQTLLDAAAALFVTSGVNAPVRDIAARAGVGVGTIYRHFPTRSDLIVAVFRHQVEACVAAAPRLLAARESAHQALAEWVDLFVDFLVTKHGLASALHGDNDGVDTLHTYFVGHLVPACGLLVAAAIATGEIRGDIGPYELLRAVGSLAAGEGQADDTAAESPAERAYDARRMAAVLIAGLRLS